MQRGQRRSRVPLLDLAQVAVEQRLLQRLRSDQVVGQRQHLAVEQDLVVPGDDRLQLRLGARRWIVPEQRVQHGHEVALAGAERAGQEGAAADPGPQRVGDQTERSVERIGQCRGHHVLAQRPLRPRPAPTLSVSRST